MNDAERWELEWLSRHAPEPLPRLSPEEQERAEAVFADAVAAWLDRAAAHAELVERTARHLGAEVARHRETIPRAERRLEELCCRLDPESAALAPLLPYPAARDIARSAFAAGYRSTPRRRVP